MSSKPTHAISPTRAEDYPQWYQQVITAADLADNSAVRGCMVIKPWGYAIWERIQAILDAQFKETGHENAYFPLLIPLNYLEKEAQHVEGFAKECAVVTHTRLEANGKGGLKPAGELEEPYIIRPTSETVIGVQFAKWIQSYRDLPVLINQWANVMRWEMRTRMFLRTSEFLWQEGHTAHATQEDAIAETKQMLNIYADFAENYAAIPVIKGEKTPAERFPGAVNTYTIEAMMQDKKALQAATSHFLGQNFAKSFDIQYLDKEGKQEFVWTTSWGMSTRMIGGLIMTHSDDDGLVLPPRLAPLHVIIIPIYRNAEDEEKVLAFCEKLQKDLSQTFYHNQVIRSKIDKRDLNSGEKSWHWIKKGVPVRLEIGPRDIEKDSVFMARRDLGIKEKTSLIKNDFIEKISSILDEIQTNIFNKAKKFQQENLHIVKNIEEFNEVLSESGIGGFVQCYCAPDDVEDIIKPMKVSARCIPLEQSGETGVCIFTGENTNRQVIFAKAY
ncbi:MAG: proline--tRNA ligase [Legionellales bacterium]|jgi:prolyl-tRNA synthetase